MTYSYISLDQWHHILDKLIDNEFLTVLDPRIFKVDLINYGFSYSEVEVINAGSTQSDRLHRWLRFLRLRPSMILPLRELLSKNHRPLLQVFENALTDSLSMLGDFDDVNKFRTALYELKEEFDILAIWALPQILEFRCITESEVHEVSCQISSLSEVLSRKSPTTVFEFLKKFHPDMIHFLRRSYERQPANYSNGIRNDKSCISIQHPPLRPFRVLSDLPSDDIELWTNIDIPLPAPSTGADLRAALACWANLQPWQVHLSRQAASVGGKDVFQVRDDKRSSWRGFTDAQDSVEYSMHEVTMEQCEWRHLDDFFPSNFSQRRRTVIRISAAPLHDFVVINEVKEHNEGRSFCEAFPLTDGGTVGELRAAVTRWMRLNCVEVLLSRRTAKRKGVDVYGIKDRRRPDWDGFCDLKDFSEFEAREVKHLDWRPLTDDDPFVAVPNRCNIIRVSRR